MCTAVLIGWNHAIPPPPPSPRIWAHIRGRYWSAKIDDISLWPPGLHFGPKEGGRATLSACGWEGRGDTIRTTGQKAWHSVYSLCTLCTLWILCTKCTLCTLCTLWTLLYRLYEAGHPSRQQQHKSIKDTMLGLLNRVTGKEDEKRKLSRNLNV